MYAAAGKAGTRTYEVSERAMYLRWQGSLLTCLPACFGCGVTSCTAELL